MASIGTAWRRLLVLGYHARRIVGANDRDRLGLLGDDQHLVSRAWLVRRSASTGRGKEFNVPALEGRVIIELLDRQGDLDVSSDTPCRWLLLARGHARDVTSVIRLEDNDARFELELGVERLAGPAASRHILSNVEPGEGGDDQRNTLRAIYSEIGAQIRSLTDVRFKLLALVPAVSALALVGIVSPTGALAAASRSVRVAAALLGLLVVLGIRMYDVRNSQLYDDLISRARLTEHALGVQHGAYMRRRSATWPLEHDRALRWVYWAVLLAWLAAAVTSGV